MVPTKARQNLQKEVYFDRGIYFVLSHSSKFTDEYTFLDISVVFKFFYLIGNIPMKTNPLIHNSNEILTVIYNV